MLRKIADRKKRADTGRKEGQVNSAGNFPSESIFPTVGQNLDFIADYFGKGIGLMMRKFNIAGGCICVGIAYIESITNIDMVTESIIKPLLESNIDSNTGPDEVQRLVLAQYISLAALSASNRMEKIINGLLSGSAIIFFEGAANAIIAGNSKLEKRAIEKPENEASALGSQESFTDNLDTNVSLIVKRLPDPRLKMEGYTVGKFSHTETRLIWLEGTANPQFVSEVRNRIQKIDIDNAGGIGVISELIEDNPLSVFPKFRQTERPDFTAFYLVNGHFAIICNNSPYALIGPISLWDNFKNTDDYDEKVVSGNYLRLVRYISFLVSILISPLYISFVTYNHTIIPPVLAFTIASGREGVPFPSVVEAILMTFAMSMIREAGLRMPGAVGYFIGTLAAVVIGQQIVNAGYVSASLIIVVAVSGVSAVAISTTTMIYTSRLLNYFFILLSGLFGMFGLISGVIFVIWHLVCQYSFNMPYLYPLIPFEKGGLSDTFIRYWFKSYRKRFRMLAPHNRNRMGG